MGDMNYFQPTTTYTSSTVSNAPTDGALIAITGNGTTTNTFTFSTPVTGLILSEVSGRRGCYGGSEPVGVGVVEMTGRLIPRRGRL